MSEIAIELYELRALGASAIVGTVCGVLGCFIVLRNMALIGDALSHSILPGVVVGFWIAGHSVLAFFTGSVFAGLFSALMITWIRRNIKTKDDSAIGIVFSVMFALGIIGISHLSRKEGVHLDLKDFLFGNVLGVSDDDLILTSLTGIYVLISVVVFYRYLMLSTFQPVIARTMGFSVSGLHYFLMLLLSFTVVSALQSVGVILVVAMLVIPASTALLLSHRLRIVLIWAGTIGLISASGGLWLAVLWDTTPGPVMTLTAGTFYLAAALFARPKGLVYGFLLKYKKREQIQNEDLLKACLVKLEKDPGPLIAEDLEKTGKLSRKWIHSGLKKLIKKGLIEKSSEGYLIPTPAGKEYGLRLIRAHRLWESYLFTHFGQEKEHIHPNAERYEHLLPEELISEVEIFLGHPEIDPHGSPIPISQSSAAALNEIPEGEEVRLSVHQPEAAAVQILWENGLTPGRKVRVLARDSNQKICNLQTEDGTFIHFSESVTAKVRVERKKNGAEV